MWLAQTKRSAQPPNTFGNIRWHGIARQFHIRKGSNHGLARRELAPARLHRLKTAQPSEEFVSGIC